MLRYESFATIIAPREAVWRVMADVVAWTEWLPTVIKVEALDGNEVRPGSRFVVHQPKLKPTTWTVSRVAAPETFVWEARSPGLRMIAEHAVMPGSSSGSSVTLSFSFGGLLGGLVGRIYRGVTQSYIEQEAASLKRRVEGRS